MGFEWYAANFAILVREKHEHCWRPWYSSMSHHERRAAGGEKIDVVQRVAAHF
jgi:hypothetical protein